MSASKVSKLVSKVIKDVRWNGDEAISRLLKKIDKVSLAPGQFRVSKARIQSAVKKINPEMKRAIEACARRIQDFHFQEKRHITQSWTYAKDGVRMGQIYNPIDSVGVYVPGGRFSYPSTLLMTAIPARMAGVRRIAVTTPPQKLSNEVLVAASVAGVDEIYQIGGPAGIAALSLGTRSIPRVDLIIGPGNALVTEAKRQLFGEVGIDLLAGPSELVVLADDSASPDLIAADMAAQAEHDPDSCATLISLSMDLIKKVSAKLPKAQVKQCGWIYRKNLAKAVEYANLLAAEHVEIMLRRPQECLDTLKNGGAFFLNEWSPAVMGDYWAGPSHVLPTGRSARFGSGLSVMTFMKRSSLIEISGAAYKKGWLSAHRMAEAEGLSQHARALRLRLGEAL